MAPKRPLATSPSKRRSRNARGEPDGSARAASTCARSRCGSGRLAFRLKKNKTKSILAAWQSNLVRRRRRAACAPPSYRLIGSTRIRPESSDSPLRVDRASRQELCRGTTQSETKYWRRKKLHAQPIPSRPRRSAGIALSAGFASLPLHGLGGWWVRPRGEASWYLPRVFIAGP